MTQWTRTYLARSHESHRHVTVAGTNLTVPFQFNGRTQFSAPF